MTAPTASSLAAGLVPARPPDDASAGLDFFNISPNHAGTLGVSGPRDWAPETVAAWILTMAEAAVEVQPLAVSHPFLHGWTGRAPTAAVLDAVNRDRLRRLFERAAALRVAIELNARKVAVWPPFYREVIALARGTGARFSLGSDAHEPAEMAYGGPGGRRGYQDLLQLLGLTPDLVWSPAWWRERPAAHIG